MKLKSLLIIGSIAAAMTANAATYYVSPEGAGSKDGTSFDNAFDVEAFTAQAAANENGDVYYFAGGSYFVPTTVVFQVATGASLYGNPEGQRTVFTGDANGNNNPEDGDSGRLVRFQANTVDGNSANAIHIKDIDFTCVFTNTDDSSNNAGALAIDNSGDVTVENCNFYNNWAQGQQGGPAAFLYRSTVKFLNCIFSNNKANYRGGAIRINSNANTKGVITFENCVIKNNHSFHDLGGAIFAGNFKSISIINSTVYGNSAETGRGGAIYFNGYASGSSGYPRLLQIINSTIAGNTTGSAENDGQIATTQSAHIFIANSVIPTADGVASIAFTGDATADQALVVSGGFNYIGSIASSLEDAPEISWETTDTYGEACTYASFFGENTLNQDNVVIPEVFVQGATGEQVAAAVSAASEVEENEWNFPAGADFSIDQLYNERTGEKTPGAVAMTEEEIENSEGITAVEFVNADSVVTVYNLQGMAVKRNVAVENALTHLPAGIYIMGGKKYIVR